MDAFEKFFSEVQKVDKGLVVNSYMNSKGLFVEFEKGQTLSFESGQINFKSGNQNKIKQ